MSGHPEQPDWKIIWRTSRQDEASVHISVLEGGEQLHSDVPEKLRRALANSCDHSGLKTALDSAMKAESVDFLLVRRRNTIRSPQSASDANQPHVVCRNSLSVF
jgi:hypothetical protein